MYVYHYRKPIFCGSALTLILGLVLAFWPVATMKTVCRAIAFILILTGAAFLIYSRIFRRNDNGPSRGFPTVIGTALLVLGLIFLVFPRTLIALIPELVGIWLVIDGAISTLESLRMLKDRYPKSKTSLLLSLITILIGVLLVTHPIKTVKWVVRIIGLSLAYTGATDIWMIRRVGNHYLEHMPTYSGSSDGPVVDVDFDKADQ